MQHALEQELGKKEAGTGAGLSVAAQKAFVETLSETLSPHSKSHGPARVDDVIRKNEVTLVHMFYWGTFAIPKHTYTVMLTIYRICCKSILVGLHMYIHVQASVRGVDATIMY